MEAIIRTNGLHKSFGNFHALRGISLEVPAGSIYGFVGPNGAGKTTTMRILTTLTKPSDGEAWVAGHSVRDDRREVRRAIGYMPDEFGVYEDLRVWEYLDFFAACYDIPEKKRKTLVADLLELVDLQHRREDMVDKLSRGMKQRLSLARTLAHDPQVLVLDEPASGLDPRARVEIRELLGELANMGKTIFFSSHILADVEDVCSHIGIIEAGEIIMQGSIDQLRQQLMAHREIIITVMDSEAAEKALALAGGMAQVATAETITPRNGRSRLRVDFTGSDEELAALSQRLFEGGVSLLGFNEEEKDLEQMFMRVTRGLVT
ncbi:MAG: ABC transporter ATP-binding protein [Chloroflexi bacterium]|nr:ABC transporter ATP-binding protein [Chloroflexota bacterium]MCY3584057.1 ABC transporter ATP-binding protein [Chloroflexota bacterium]MCY3716129.1 ABC transporter ATP-binding protein [Chloroflexota bacterium]MDE2649660.1 ABC transporter ATP-binding protein [Chloroflexota bacterium]MXX51114.1 ABC transporter ATP-binding protein [Chloroflexota bacterium]